MGATSRYILHKRIARGGMAEIFLATHVGQDGFRRLCCVKRILPHYSEDAEFVEMFRDEAHIGKRLNHVNIVGIESFEQVEGSYGIIMEFVNGSDLRSILSECERKGRRLSTAMATYLVAEAARGLHYAHTKIDDLSGHPLGIIHRDISPQNILISYEGEAKITDFGIAAASSKLTETKPGIVKGKYNYMSPEQISARPLDARSDIFALAVVLWETLSMRRLFQGESEVATIQLVKNCAIPDSLSALNPDVDSELEQIVRKGLQKQIADRYRNAGEFANTLTRYLAKYHANFTPDDLKVFLHDLLKDKITDARETIRNALDPSTHADPSSQATALVNQATMVASTPSLSSSSSSSSLSASKQRLMTQSGQNFSIKQQTNSRSRRHSATPVSSIHSPIQQNNHNQQYRQRIPRAKPQHAPPQYNRRDSNSFSFIFFAAILAAVAIIAADYIPRLYIDQKSHLILRTKPSRVRIQVDGKPIFKGKYIDTSQGRPIPLDVNGRYNISVQREGFLPESIKIQTPDEGSLRRSVTLTPLQTKIAPVKVILKEKAQVWVELDNGMYAGIPPIPLDHVSFGQQHELKVYGRNQKTLLFECRFVPRATTWANPYLVRLDINKKSCDYPPSEE